MTNFIECFWEYETADIELEHTIIPDGYFDLIATFEKGILSRVKLTGVWTKPVNVKISKQTKLFAIRFKLLATEYLFQHEIRSILNTSKTLPLHFWNIDKYQTNDFDKFALAITNRLESSIKHLQEIDNRKLKLFELVYNKPIHTVDELATNVFWSSRQINRYFTSRFGFSLKTFLNVVRCNASYHEIAKGNLFPDNNFFDQSHFIKEIRKHTGTTPRELFKNQNVRFLQLTTRSGK
nr:AraC family transcriptional regulator [Longitalea arenae]